MFAFSVHHISSWVIIHVYAVSARYQIASLICLVCLSIKYQVGSLEYVCIFCAASIKLDPQQYVFFVCPSSIKLDHLIYYLLCVPFKYQVGSLE